MEKIICYPENFQGVGKAQSKPESKQSPLLPRKEAQLHEKEKGKSCLMLWISFRVSVRVCV